VTPVGDIELEIVVRIAVRGRARDLAQLLEVMNKAEAAVIWLIERAPGGQGAEEVKTTAGGVSG